MVDTTTRFERVHQILKTRPELLERMEPREIDQLVTDLIAEKNREYAYNPFKWATEQVFTIDEADQTSKRFSSKAYVEDAFTVLQHESMIALPKSRRMLGTWTVAAWLTHQARFFRNHAAFVQSEIEAKAAFVVDKRCKYIEDHLMPAAFRRDYTSIKTKDGLVGQQTYVKTNSYIKGVAQGADALRTYTPSILVLDESEFQAEARAALVAALPFAEKGAQLILISSSNGPNGPIADIARSIGFVRF